MTEGNGDKISLEVADAEFARFAAAWDIDDNVDSMSQEDRDSFNMQRTRIVREIKRGNATINEAGDILFKLTHPKGSVTDIKFCVPSGDAYISMDNHKDRQSMHKLYSFMGSMTKQPPKLFSSMDSRDIKFCMGVASLFLAS